MRKSTHTGRGDVEVDKVPFLRALINAVPRINTYPTALGPLRSISKIYDMIRYEWVMTGECATEKEGETQEAVRWD